MTFKSKIRPPVPDCPGLSRFFPHLKMFLFFPAPVATLRSLCSLWLMLLGLQNQKRPKFTQKSSGITRVNSPLLGLTRLNSHKKIKIFWHRGLHHCRTGRSFAPNVFPVTKTPLLHHSISAKSAQPLVPQPSTIFGAVPVRKHLTKAVHAARCNDATL